MVNMIVRIVFSLVVITLYACGGGNDPNNADTSQRDLAREIGTLNGFIRDASDGLRLANVNVSVAGQTVTTNDNGEFTIKDLVNDDYIVQIEKTRYVTSYQNIKISDTSETVLVSLKTESQKQDYDVSTEATISEQTNNGPYAVIFQPDSLDTTDTELKVSVTPLDPTVEADALPGQLETDTAMLVPLTFAEFSIYDSNNNKVNLKEGKEAIVELPIPVSLRNFKAYALGQTIHCYSYNPVTGQWEDFVVGTVVRSSVDGNTPVVRASIKHFSWYGAAPQSSECIDIYGKIISNLTGAPIPFASVEAFPGSATNSDVNGFFRLATAAIGSPKITASRTFLDVDGSVSGVVGSRVIEYGSSIDISLAGLDVRACSDEPGSLLPGSNSDAIGSPSNLLEVSIGKLDILSYEVFAFLSNDSADGIESGSIVVTVSTNFADENISGEAVSGAKIKITSIDGFSLDVEEIFAGSYIANISPIAGQQYVLTVDADNNGTVDGSGAVFVMGEVNFVNPVEGSIVNKEDFTVSWSDSAYDSSTLNPAYSSAYWVWLTSTSIVDESSSGFFGFDSANYFGTDLSFLAKSNINQDQNLLPGDYEITLLSFSGAYNLTANGVDSTLVNNITGPSVNGQFFVLGSTTEKINFTVQ